MTVVVDASAVAAALAGSGEAAAWAIGVMRAGRMAAPYLLPAEVASVLRRAEIAGDISPDVAAQAYADLIDLPVDLYPFEPFATRIWELRGNLVPYDAWYVALAETLEAPLATLDTRLAAAPGPSCRFDLPPTG